MSEFKNAFVVTGSIGSGKSTFVNLLKSYGFDVIDADEISHKELEKSLDEVTAEFGEEILTDGKIDRKKLGNIVFNDKNSLKRLENLLHPKIMRAINLACERCERVGSPYFVDIPLFYEGLGRYGFDKVIVVYAPKNLLIERVMRRNGLKFDEAKRRVELQIDIEKKREMANCVIDNSGNLANLEAQTQAFLARIRDEMGL